MCKLGSQEYRDMQRKRIYKTKPWEKSTGAKTPEGKAISKMNGVKDKASYFLIKEYERLMKQQKELNDMVSQAVQY
jgi:hypothetical protein